MQPILNACVYIVDDDAIVRDAMAWLLRSRRLMSETFDSAESFAAMLEKNSPKKTTHSETSRLYFVGRSHAGTKWLGLV